ncbi:hypothetical protein [Companilactobacillus futsaii]|uniref:Uncharacterized protein n=2 Tax=Companilactobacillus futsaii TaxID=938155 RepID=A0A5B7SZX3_9LACO|nr:hypothetical protein [Companilactobacillus futsaii]KRK92606.1 hypothetical protein FC88_GL000723 [Companilactobacillus futsaii JCM 17355]QCX25356.1 hypothetical protein FG051_09770 [Companilactobacillus futsaii]
MKISNLEDLKKAIDNRESGFEVERTAFEFCDEIHREQVMGSGAEWSIATTAGWMGLVTSFNHWVHRKFMSEAKKQREDIKHVIIKEYIIKKTDQANKYELVLRK